MLNTTRAMIKLAQRGKVIRRSKPVSRFAPRCAVMSIAVVILLSSSLFSLQAQEAGTNQPASTPPRVTIEQVIKPPKGQRIRFSDAGVKFPAGTMATLVLKAEGTKESTEFDLTFVKSFGTVAVFRSSEQGFFVAYGAVDLGVVQFMPPVRSDFVPFSNYTSGMTLTAKDIISIWKTRFDSVIGASLTQLAQQSEEVQAERCESLVNIPHTAAGTLLKKLSVSMKPEVAKKAREALLKWNEIDAAISVKPVQPTPKPLPPKK